MAIWGNPLTPRGARAAVAVSGGDRDAMDGDLICAPAARGAVFRLTVPAGPPSEPFLELGQLAQWRRDADSAGLISIGSPPSTSRQRPV